MFSPRYIPRRLATLATVVGGLIGIFLSNRNGWDFAQTFLFTLLICLGLIALTALVYTLFTNCRA